MCAALLLLSSTYYTVHMPPMYMTMLDDILPSQILSRICSGAAERLMHTLYKTGGVVALGCEIDLTMLALSEQMKK
jgi:hypothetical protein